jgi:REP element-mobilizing transposase RayT
MPGYVHMLVSIPTKFSAAEVIGFIKGKSSIWIARNIGRKARKLRANKRNARQHSEKQIAQIADSIATFGFLVPNIIDDQGLVLAGHGTSRGSQASRVAPGALHPRPPPDA